ncbi:MAG: prepilin-type N-terminal cleavage/methylation domain-containing protein [Rickettsiales bacterium]
MDHGFVHNAFQLNLSPKHAATKLRHGFSLVELSIVLVILGLLVGGVLLGQSLINAARIKAVGNEYSAMYTAAQAFVNQYRYYPGDIPTATRYWGSNGGTGLASDTACSDVPSTTPATCNGDGDKILQAGTEALRAWQHMASAGLISGSYTGARAVFSPGYTGFWVAGLNVPNSKFSKEGRWRFVTRNNTGADTTTFASPYVPFMISFFADSTTGLGLLTKDAWHIDTKFDDGFPGTGIIRSLNKGDGITTFCTSVAGSMTDAGATYRVDLDRPDCQLQYYNPL